MEFGKKKVLSNTLIKNNIYSIKVDENSEIIPGQFYMLKLDYPLLPRPLSVCEIGNGYVEFCYAVVGKGTEKLSAVKAGEDIYLTGPLGNGFNVSEVRKYQKIALISGGIGIAPFIELEKRLNGCDISVFCGFSDYTYMTERFKSNVVVSTENGRKGYKGYITEYVDIGSFDLVIACGPEAFMKVIISKCSEQNVECLVSMDKHMACGVGACLVCVCKTINGNKRCCADGPVFYGGELIL